MTAKRGGLGRNLSVLLGKTEVTAAPNPTLKPERHLLSVTKLQPGKYQPRTDLDEASLSELTESIKKQGLLQPVLVREISPDRFEIIAGERRWRACQLAHMTDIPVIIKQVDDETAMAMALVENLQRENLNVMDEARAMHRLTTEFSLTHQQVAELVSKSRAAVSNYLRLMNLSPSVKRLLENGDLDMGHARCLLILDESQQSEVATLVVAKNLSVRETEALVARVKSGMVSHSNSEFKAKTAPVDQEFIRMLSKKLSAKISLKTGKAGKGTLLIHYENEQSLAAIVSTLERV